MRDTRRALAPYTAIVLLFVLFFLWLIGKAQAPASYKPTEVQTLRLQVKQRDAWLAQRDAIESQRRYQQAIAELNALGEDIRKENGWPTTVLFNPDKVEFSAPPANTARPGAPAMPAPPTKGPVQ